MKHGIYFLALLLMSGCTLARVNVEMLSERTALENQVLGTYNSLDAQMLLVASVRGVDPDGAVSRPPPHSREYQNAIAAMQTLDFHADDIDAFKRLGWAGEDNRGFIAPFGINRAEVPDDLKAFADRYAAEEFDDVVSSVNDARRVLMERVIRMNENLKETDMPRVQRVFAKINAENAAPGVRIQSEDGAWIVKQEAK